MLKNKKLIFAACFVAITMPITFVALGYDNAISTANQLLAGVLGVAAAGLGILAVANPASATIAIAAAVLSGAAAILALPSPSAHSLSSTEINGIVTPQLAQAQSISYQDIVDPIIYPVSKVHPDKLTSKALAGLTNKLTETTAQQIAFIRAWRDANNKALEAEVVADPYWIKLQNARAGLFASEISSLFDQLKLSLSNLATQWTLDGLPNTTLTQDKINAAIDIISTQGLPDKYISVLRQLKLTDSEISRITAYFKGGSLLADLDGKSYPQSLIESALVSAIDGAKEQYALYAESRVSRIKINVKPRPYWMPLIPPIGKSKIVLVDIYGSSNFDVKRVNLKSLRFGANAPVISMDQWPFRFISPPSFMADVNRDGYNDLVVAFWMSESGYGCEANVAVLVGETNEGLSFGGLDIFTNKAIHTSYACTSMPFFPGLVSQYTFNNFWR